MYLAIGRNEFGSTHDEAMNKVLRNYILDVTMQFLDDIPIKGCPKNVKEELVEP